jgi:hypothetical protein
MANEPTDSSAEKDMKCPICGCDKPKAWVEGRYRCVDCTCAVDDACWGALEDG